MIFPTSLQDLSKPIRTFHVEKTWRITPYQTLSVPLNGSIEGDHVSFRLRQMFTGFVAVLATAETSQGIV